MSDYVVPLSTLLQSLVQRLDAVENRLGVSAALPAAVPAPVAVAAAPAAPVEPPFIKAFDSFVQQHCAPFAEACGAIGGKATKLGEFFMEGFKLQVCTCSYTVAVFVYIY